MKKASSERRCFFVGSDGFEPPKLEAADLQSAPFGRSGNHPYVFSHTLSHALRRASCRIRTNDPEITNHVLWPTELKRQILAAVKPLIKDLF